MSTSTLLLSYLCSVNNPYYVTIPIKITNQLVSHFESLHILQFGQLHFLLKLGNPTHLWWYQCQQKLHPTQSVASEGSYDSPHVWQCSSSSCVSIRYMVLIYKWTRQLTHSITVRHLHVDLLDLRFVPPVLVACLSVALFLDAPKLVKIPSHKLALNSYTWHSYQVTF